MNASHVGSQRLQKLIYLHLFTDCSMKISLPILRTNPDLDLFQICSEDWREIFMKQPVQINTIKLTSVISVHKVFHWALYHVWNLNYIISCKFSNNVTFEVKTSPYRQVSFNFTIYLHFCRPAVKWFLITHQNELKLIHQEHSIALYITSIVIWPVHFLQQPSAKPQMVLQHI